jgi:hypothetical protein
MMMTNGQLVGKALTVFPKSAIRNMKLLNGVNNILQMKYSFIISKDRFENAIPMGKTLIPLKDKFY